MKRIDTDYTRREMSRIPLRVRPNIAALFKEFCKEQGTSMNQSLEQCMIKELKAAGKIK